MNELDPDLQFIFEELTKNINFLDISFKINNKLHFDVYHVVGQLEYVSLFLENDSIFITCYYWDGQAHTQADTHTYTHRHTHTHKHTNIACYFLFEAI